MAVHDVHEESGTLDRVQVLPGSCPACKLLESWLASEAGMNLLSSACGFSPQGHNPAQKQCEASNAQGPYPFLGSGSFDPPHRTQAEVCSEAPRQSAQVASQTKVVYSACIKFKLALPTRRSSRRMF